MGGLTPWAQAPPKDMYRSGGKRAKTSNDRCPDCVRDNVPVGGDTNTCARPHSNGELALPQDRRLWCASESTWHRSVSEGCGAFQLSKHQRTVIVVDTPEEEKCLQGYLGERENGRQRLRWMCQWLAHKIARMKAFDGDHGRVKLDVAWIAKLPDNPVDLEKIRNSHTDKSLGVPQYPSGLARWSLGASAEHVAYAQQLLQAERGSPLAEDLALCAHYRSGSDDDFQYAAAAILLARGRFHDGRLLTHDPILVRAVRARKLELVRALIQAGADLNECRVYVESSRWRWNAESALFVAVQQEGTIDLVRMLLRCGARHDLRTHTQHGDIIRAPAEVAKDPHVARLVACWPHSRAVLQLLLIWKSCRDHPISQLPLDIVKTIAHIVLRSVWPQGAQH